MTKEQIEQQRKQYAAILNGIRKSGLREEQILELVQQIAKGMSEISESSKPRSLSEEQRRYLITKLKVVQDTSILITVNAGADNRLYAQNFLDVLETDLKWKSTRKGFFLEEVPITGVYFVISREDNDAHTVPDGCVLMDEALDALHLIDDTWAITKGQPSAPERGTCTLYISRRKVPGQK